MDTLLFIFILWITKTISLIISFFHLGQASNFPGKLALIFQKNYLRNFKLKNDCKIILVTGTNGKSTTCGILANILKQARQKVIYNKSGANLLSGIATTLSYYSDILGNLNYNFLILEVDEASLPLITLQLNANFIAVTNFFRDQLDRFGELDTSVKLIEKGINNTNNTILFLNADDPRVAFLSSGNKKIFFGIDNSAVLEDIHNKIDNTKNEDWISDPEETTSCKRCNSNLIYTKKFLAHLGDYKCLKCNLKRPTINFLVSDFKADNLTINFDLVSNGHKNNFFSPMTGIFNLYNALCAIAIAKTVFNITPIQIQKGFQTYSTIFGRGEKVILNNKTVWIYLIKNPSGTTEVLKMIRKIPNGRFLIALNDNYADGRDVSWIWDARFDLLARHSKEIFVSGKRAEDMALRLQYSGIEPRNIKIEKDIFTATKYALNNIDSNETLYLLPTYTVLLEMQQKGISKAQPLN